MSERLLRVPAVGLCSLQLHEFGLRIPEEQCEAAQSQLISAAVERVVDGPAQHLDVVAEVLEGIGNGVAARVTDDLVEFHRSSDPGFTVGDLSPSRLPHSEES